ncbi:MAG: ABC transporter ATP-binding protein [Colwellia sp.]|nr:ABC transporter ATP-binding protein [Colwellia sp.]
MKKRNSNQLEIKKLCVSLQGNDILSEVNLSLASGDILGLVGPSGCGKSTLLNTIAGFINQSHGELIVGVLGVGEHDDGELLIITPEHNVAPEHRNIGMIFQDYALFPHLTVEQNIIFGINKLSKRVQQSRLKNLMHLLKLTNLEARFPHQLSGGQQQRVAIARALAPQPKLLLLDEPFSNIDARLRNELMLEMRQLLKNLNISAIFVTHNKDEVFTFADKIAVMHQGHILQSGCPAAVCQQPNNWQVADFLQLGSWLPVKQISSTQFQSALGKINISKEGKRDTALQQLLLKPQYIELSQLSGSAQGKVNVRVDNISVTEQGYHYLLSSLVVDELAFDQLSFYSNELFSLGQTLMLVIKEHKFVMFIPTTIQAAG